MASLVLFGPQGSATAFSQRALDQAIDDATCSALANALLSRCHAAFLQDSSSIESETPFGSENTLPDTPLALLSFPAVECTHPIIEVTRLCLYQLLRYARSDPFSLIIPPTDLGCTGFSSGIVPAVVAAASQNFDDYLIHGVAAFRMVFWMGYRNWQWRQHNEDASSETAKLPCSLAVRCEDQQQKLRDALESDFPTLTLAGVTDRNWVTVSGWPKDLSALKDFCDGVLKLQTRSLHIHGYYHGGQKLQSMVHAIREDLRIHQIEYTRYEHLKRRVICPSVDASDDANLTNSETLLAQILTYLLVDPFDWMSISESVANQLTSIVDEDEDALVLVTCVGPSSGDLCNGLKKGLKSGLSHLSMRDLWLTTNPPNHVSPLSSCSDDIAIVGMALDLPDAPNIEKFWEILLQAKSTMQQIPDSRFEASQLKQDGDGNTKGENGKPEIRYGNFLNDIWGLDHAFFGISPREGKSIDPQQKVLLRVVKAALENAGYVADSTPSFQRESFGCYVGAATGDYTDNLKDDIDVYYSPGTLRAFLSGRLSYQYGFSGPSVVIDTACSSSAVAIHQACRALQNGDCTTALAGGVNTISSPDMYRGLNRGHFLSPTGQCKPFDASADGYCRAEGCGIFVLKKASAALAENDRILGIIRGVDVNQSGNSCSITRPDASTQASLISRLLRRTKIDASTVGAVEAHGTGTQAGDNCEAKSLHGIFSARKRRSPVFLSSVKGNIGHCEAASGSAGLVKLILMLRHGKVPAQASLKTINPSLADFVSGSLVIPRETVSWKRSGIQPKRCILNNFGAAGSNACLILEEHVTTERPTAGGNLHRSAYPFVISVRNMKAATGWRDSYLAYLESAEDELQIKDICYTATARRQRYENTFALPCSSVSDLQSQLQSFDPSQPEKQQSEQELIFVFSGQGVSSAGRAKELMETCPLFSSLVFQCDRILQHLGVSGVVDFLISESGDLARFSDAELVVVSQCAGVVFQYALSKLWMSWNIVPTGVVGHSIGEYAALIVAGALSIEDCLLIVSGRAKAIAETCEKEATGMLACRFAPSAAKDMLDGKEDWDSIEIVCQNSPKDCVVGGALSQLKDFASFCSKESLKTTFLDLPFAFHSAAMDSTLESIKKLADSVTLSPMTLGFFSAALGRRASDSDITSDYFVAHTRQPVLFMDAIRHMESQMESNRSLAWLEIGPHTSTLPLVSASLESRHDGKMLGSSRKDAKTWVTLSNTLCQLAPSTENIDWRKVFEGTDARLMDLPGHPLFPISSGVPYVEHKLLESDGNAILPERHFHFALFRLPPSQSHMDVFETEMIYIGSFIAGHKVGGTAICPASVCYELALEAAHSNDNADPDGIWTARHISFSKPIIYRGKVDDENRIRVILVRNGNEAAEFKIELKSKTSEQFEICAHGNIELVSKNKLSSSWSREQALVKRQRSHLMRNNKHGTNFIQCSMLYDIMFQRVVDYSSEYHSIQELSVSVTGEEAYGSVQFPQSSHGHDLISPPVVSDTLLHAAGFVANTYAKPDDAFICDHIESVDVLYTDLDLNAKYKIYTSLLHVQEGLVVADSFLLNAKDRIIAVSRGVHFRKVPLSRFRMSLSRSNNDGKSQKLASPRSPSNKTDSSAEIQDSGYDSGVSLSSQASTGATTPDFSLSDLKRLVAKTCGMAEDQIDANKTLGDLGIDSMMIIELTAAIERESSGTVLSKDPGPSSTLQSLFDNVDIPRRINDAALKQACSEVAKTSSVDRHSAPPSKENSKTITEILASLCGTDIDALLPNIVLDTIGVDSMMKIELHEAIEHKMDVSVSLDEVSACTSVGDLQSLVKPSGTSQSTKTARSENQQPSIHMLQPGKDSEASCYLFHDGSGTCAMYKRLGVIGPALWGISSPSSSQEDLVAMAATYVEAIESRDDKEIILGGWSFGGVLAYETACQLLSRGRTVKGLVLIDSPFPVNHTGLPSKIVEYVLNKTPAFSQASESARGLMVSRFRLHANALEAYRPSSCPAKLKAVYLESRDSLDTENLCGQSYPWLSDSDQHRESTRKWLQLFKSNTEMKEIPGNHFEVFDDANIQEVSKSFGEAMAYLK